MGSWKFPQPLKVDDRVVFEDMIHYTTVKTNMFNGISHPSIALLRANGELEMFKVFGYEDYRDRMC
jgi:carboxynorspermidine decarboxylase